MTTDDMLARLGLQTRTSSLDLLLPALGVFGVGMLVGAGVALVLAPKSGSELRRDLGRGAASLRDRVRRDRDTVMDLEAQTRDELYAQAQELDIEGRSDMTKAQLAKAVRAAS
jgi:gas vesicle protein